MTEQAKHTLGPWEVSARGSDDDDSFYCAIVAIGRDVVIADTLNCSYKLGPDDQRSNANLIAAAPEMLHALEMVRDANRDEPHIPLIALATIEAAIAKAKGRT